MHQIQYNIQNKDKSRSALLVNLAALNKDFTNVNLLSKLSSYKCISKAI